MSRPLLAAGLLALLCVWLAGSGCSSTSLSSRLVAPGGASPLLGMVDTKTLLEKLPTRSGTLPGRDGVPIFWRAFDPGEYGFEYHFKRSPNSAGTQHVAFDFNFNPRLAAQPRSAPRGTVILLHGWMMDGNSLLPWSLSLAQAGYRAIALDLRNHGQSGSGLAGYGTRESDDVVRVIGELRERGEIVGPLYLFGVSYGAATALFSADKLGDQVAGVVAVESFANAGRGIRDMVPHMLAETPRDWEARAVSGYMRWRYGDQNLDQVIAAADQQLGIQLDRLDVAPAVTDTRACVLLLHGDADRHIPVAHGRLLAASAPRAHYLELHGENHLSLPMRVDLLAPMVEQWFAANPQAQAQCPAPLQLPAGDAIRADLNQADPATQG
ncbi:MAG TPA: alpha/beta hydrolase [Stenotrophomonas sp.]|nr:alpha/beta hydrolase [Stenotrophomonas sp.]